MRQYSYEDVTWWSTTVMSDPILYQILFATAMIIVALYFGKDSSMSHRINVAYATGPNWNNSGTSYRHFFAVDTTLIVNESGRNLLTLVDSLRAAYPTPEYDVTVSRRTSYSNEVDI